MQESEFKIVFVGSMGVGKTSVINRYTYENFSNSSKPTLGLSFIDKTIELTSRGNASVKLKIWDTAGQEKLRSLASIHYKDASAIIMVYDITSKSSFSDLKGWLEEVRKQSPENALIVIAGNKSDRIDEEQVRMAEVKELALHENATYTLTSAVQNEGITEMFTELATKLYDKSCSEKRVIIWITFH